MIERNSREGRLIDDRLMWRDVYVLVLRDFERPVETDLFVRKLVGDEAHMSVGLGDHRIRTCVGINTRHSGCTVGERRIAGDTVAEFRSFRNSSSRLCND